MESRPLERWRALAILLLCGHVYILLFPGPPARGEGLPYVAPPAALYQPAQPPPRSLADAYLEVVENGVTGTLYDTPNLLPQWPGYNETLRMRGNDWPEPGHTMVGHLRLRQVRDALRSVVSGGVEGDFVELGTWRGGVCIMARAVMVSLGVAAHRTVHLFDAYAPLKEYGPFSYYLETNVDKVRHYFSRYGLLDEGVVFHKGLFMNTVPQFRKERLSGARGGDPALARRIAVLRVDGNFYDSYADALYCACPCARAQPRAHRGACRAACCTCMHATPPCRSGGWC